MFEVLCDKRVAAEVKGKVYKRAVRRAVLFGLETVAVGGRVKGLQTANIYC